MIEYMNGADLDEVKSVTLTDEEVANLDKAIRLSELRCKRSALEFKAALGTGPRNRGEGYLDEIIELKIQAEKAQNEYGMLRRTKLGRSMWVPV